MVAPSPSADALTGSYFVSNYPPFGHWHTEAVPAVQDTLARPPVRDTPLGVYVHIPFCRVRCKFCYFKVHTEVPGAEVRAYVDAVLAEAALWSEQPAIAGRPVDYLYVGGGTPSYLSVGQIERLLSGLRAALPWAADHTGGSHHPSSLTFEAEPGTVRPHKLAALRDHGVDRLSLGVESFQPHLLERNGRAHGAQHIQPAVDMARAAGFPHLNIDLIAGLMGATEADWQADVAATVALQPESVTIYQMEVPRNTWVYKQIRAGQADLALPDWPTKRRWVAEAFQALEAAGYTITSGYTAVRRTPATTDTTFAYRDLLWHGADLLPLGASSFGHVQGTHLQNHKGRADWMAAIHQGSLPLHRGYALSDDERLIRQTVLQLKLGRLDVARLRRVFGVDPAVRFAAAVQQLTTAGHLTVHPDHWTLSRNALLQIDRLLPLFFLQEHGGPSAATAPGSAHVA